MTGSCENQVARGCIEYLVVVENNEEVYKNNKRSRVEMRCSILLKCFLVVQHGDLYRLIEGI